MHTTQPSHADIDLQIDVQYLNDNCDFRSKEHVRREFSHDDLAEMKDMYFQMASKVTAREELNSALSTIAKGSMSVTEELTEIVEALPASDHFGSIDLKTLKSNASAMLRKINSGYEIEEEQLYAFHYHSCSRTAFYDQNGLFVYDRSMKPGENQTSILNLKKAS